MDSNAIRNLESARVSYPGMVVRTSDAQDATYEWRTNLLRSEQYWATWLDGMNQRFLYAPTRKLLILAGGTPVDAELKQGLDEEKFQLVVFPEAGHAVQEDNPTRMAQEVFAFSQAELGL